MRLGAGFEEHAPVAVAASPERGRYERTIPATPLDGGRALVRVARPTALGWFGTEVRVDAEARALAWQPRGGCAPPAACAPERGDVQHSGRLSLDLAVERPVGDRRLVLRTTAAGAVGPLVPAQELAYAGGPTTGPGYRFHEFAGRAVATQRVEWQLPIPFVAVPLGRFGRAAPRATLAPFAHVVYVARPADWQAARSGWYPAVGVGSLMFFDLLRADVARGLRDGRWTVSLDVGRAFWPVL
jgi:hypothetical protein